MSKFVDKLHNLSRTSVSPIGFHAAISKPVGSPMLLVAGLSGTGVKSTEAIASVNADAGLIWSQGIKGRSLKRMIKAMGDIPLGVVVGGTDRERISDFVGSGCDFVVFDIKMSAAALDEKGVGKFLAIDTALDIGLVKAVNALDIDGVFLSKDEDLFITVEYLLVCRHFSELLNKPLMISLTWPITDTELGNLRKAGVDGIVVPPAQSIEALVKLREMIDNLPKEARRGQGKVVDVTLPHYEGDIVVEDEEEI